VMCSCCQVWGKPSGSPWGSDGLWETRNRDQMWRSGVPCDTRNGFARGTGNAAALAEAMEKFISGERSFDSVDVRSEVVRRFGERVFLDNISSIYQQI